MRKQIIPLNSELGLSGDYNAPSAWGDVISDGVDDDTLEHLFWLEDSVPESMQPLNYNKEKREPYVWRQWLKEREKPSGLMMLALNPYMLLMLTSVFDKQNELPDNRGELFKEFVDTLMERENVPEDEQTPMINGLAQVAYEMQIQRQNLPSPSEAVGRGQGVRAITH